MLRPLDNDPESKRFMQPKLEKDFDEGERAYVEQVAPARERDLQRSRALAARVQFQEDVRALIEQDVTEPKQIAKRLGCSEQKVVMTLRELRLID